MSSPSTEFVSMKFKNLAAALGYDFDVEAALLHGILKQRPYPSTKKTSSISLETVFSELSNRMESRQFHAWIEPLRISEHRGNQLILSAPNDFSADWVRDHYLSTILEAIHGTHELSKDFSIEVIASLEED